MRPGIEQGIAADSSSPDIAANGLGPIYPVIRAGSRLGEPTIEATPTEVVAQRDAVYRRMLALADMVASLVALAICLPVLGEDRLTPWIVLMFPLVVVVAKLKGLYERDAMVLNKTTLDEAPALFQAATLYALLLAVAAPVLVQGSLSARQVVGVWLTLFATAIAGRTTARRLARMLTEPERCLVVGTSDDLARVATKLHERASVSATVVGRVSITPGDIGREGEHLGALDGLAGIVHRHRVQRIIVAPREADSDLVLEAVRAAKALGVHVSVLPRLLEVIGSSVEFDQLYGVTIMGVRRFGMSRSSAFVKRGLDVTVSAAMLLALAPVMAVLALLVRWSSPGPVFFRQTRIGHGGRPFEMLKFRSMVRDADARKAELRNLNEAPDGLFKIKDDPRITRVGRLMRRTSLDELPQLVNVLRGEMSLVGPRPLVPDEDERIEGGHRRRLQLKPGMTGHWQIFGSSRIPIQEMVTIDYLYVANWSLWGDVKTLLRTVPYVLSRQGL